jgi:hypothetical protein
VAKKKELIQTVVDPPIAHAVRMAAAAEKRTLANYLRVLLEEKFDRTDRAK